MRRLFLLFVIISLPFCLYAIEKSQLDLNFDTEPAKSLLKAESRYGSVSLKNGYTELTLLSGGYFTLGTTGGLSPQKPDDYCSLSFGHPHALTSFPIFCIDGKWYEPDGYFPEPVYFWPIKTAQSLAVTLIDSGVFALNFTLSQAEDGKRIDLSLKIKNLASQSHNLGLGLVFDPALGRWSDGVFTSGNEIISQPALFSADGLPDKIELWEQPAAPRGLGLEWSFSAPKPDLLVANWPDIYHQPGAGLPQNAIQAIYDLTLKFFWGEQSFAPGEERSYTLSAQLLPPDFGTKLFARWDLPSFLALENNLLFPRLLSSYLQIFNLSGTRQDNLDVKITGPSTLQPTQAEQGISLAPDSILFLPINFIANDVYEDEVAAIAMQCQKSGQTMAELSRNVFIPAVPLSDTGLVVQIDTLNFSDFPNIQLVFESRVEATGQILTHLSQQNVFLYENDTRIKEFELAKDTSGGVNAADIVFVLDVTGSMGDEINDVKNNIIEFADSLSARGVDYRLGMVTFLDIIENVYPFTQDVQAFQRLVGQQFAHGGGDTPENSLAALQRASQFPFRAEAKRIFVWITDADYHERDSVTPLSRQEVINALLANDVTVHAIGANSYKSAYDPIILATGGNFYDIYGNFRDILIDISRLKATGRFLLAYKIPILAKTMRTIKIKIHYAGLGGSVTRDYLPPLVSNAGKPLACFPNPFNASTRIQLNVPANLSAEIVIYNLLGQRIWYKKVDPARHSTDIIWHACGEDNHPVSSGFYFVQLLLFDGRGQLSSQQVERIVYLK